MRTSCIATGTTFVYARMYVLDIQRREYPVQQRIKDHSDSCLKTDRSKLEKHEERGTRTRVHTLRAGVKVSKCGTMPEVII